ncbi:MAG TPA: alpha-amylase family glycosyl hydrolase [Tepidisphaeraceae bacterium]|nr:alpha-amylase family glycosyl hydrolase [Tepidisphaeraceae bacterium]
MAPLMIRTPALLAAVIVLLLAGSTAVAQEHDHEFKYKPDDQPRTVHVAGDFNNWSKDATPMKKGGDNVWSATVKLAEGVHLYKFVVNGDQWRPDPSAEKSLEVDDGHGGKNSGVLVGGEAEKFPPPKPNDIKPHATRHDSHDPRDASVFAAESLLLMVRTQADDVQRVVARVRADQGPARDVPLRKIFTRNGFDRWGGVVTGLRGDTSEYVFILTDGSKTVWLNGHGLIAPPNDPAAPPDGSIKLPLKSRFQTPDWAKHAVWYQIFPERFRNGDKANDPGDKAFERLIPWTHNWWTPAPGEAPGDENFYQGQGNVWKRRYGGDVQGLIEALPYLKKLGINAIYLNPVFEADSMHKYDASDFRHIDDNFGFKGDSQQLSGETDDPKTWQWTRSDKLFLDFVDKAHQMGFKVVIDGVFNHVGKSHPFFQDVLKNGKKSRYANWFEITDWESSPPKYKAWDKDNGELPVFKKDPKRGLAKGPYEHVMAVTKRWLAPDGDPKRGVDGWRLDVPGDIPHPFWIEWRKTVKAAKPDAYTTGEIWTWAQPWLKGDQFDAVMNYRWADAAQAFFVNQQKAIQPGEFNDRLNAIAYTYPFQVSLCLQNLFDSHDTDRFASMFVNPDLPYDGGNRLQDNGPQYKKDKPTPEMVRRMLQAVAVQHATVGAPMTYYGNEAGMWSPDDPSNRMPMTWPEMKFDDPQVRFEPEVFDFFQRAIAARNTLPQLRLGMHRGVMSDDARGVYAFARDLGDQQAVVVINRSNQEQTISVPADGADGVKLINWLDPQQAELSDAADPAARATLKPKGGAKQSSVTGGAFSITLKPFESAILSRP